ncbi:hypothetical protein JCM10296v2_003035 [Rhodotorula toruloides]
MAGWGSLAQVPGEVGTFTVLKSQPKSDEALAILKKIHAMVKPIMKKHGWFLPTLAEFYPSQENLLGINVSRGWKICLRLRPAHDPHSFLPLEDAQHCLIGTMLHELSHNVRGPHDDIFFKTMDGLYDEFDQLRAKGYLGFAGEGRRVGEGVAHDGPIGMREAREKALKRMEEAERMRKLLGQGGKLGGRAPDTKGKRRGDILADAAERRLRAQKACGGDDAHNHPSGSKQEDLPPQIQDAINQADRDSRRIVIDLTNLSDSEDEVAPAPKPSTSKRASPRKARESSSSFIEVEVIRKRPKVEDDESNSSSLPSRPSTSSASSASSRTSASSRSSASSSTSRLSAPSRSSTSKPARTYPPSRSTQPISQPGAWSTERAASTLVGVSTPPIVGRGAVAVPERLPRFGSARTLDNGIGWSCHVCSTLNEDIFWCCSMCQTVKLSSERG